MRNLLACAVTSLLVGCGGGASPLSTPSSSAPLFGVPSTGVSIGSLPDAKTIAALVAKLDVSCKETCCLPAPEWTRAWGPELSPEAHRAIRGVLESTKSPAELALAIRIAAREKVDDLAPRLAKLVDDTRPGGSLPEERLGQTILQCYPVTWTPATPSSEALRALGKFHGTTFAKASDYHAWALAHPNPEHSFEVWNARLSRQEPPPKELVDKLRETDPALFVSILLYRCRGDDRCGANVSELNSAVKTQIGVERALRWLEASEPVPYVATRGSRSADVGETYANLLRGADVIFTTKERPALVAMWKGRTFQRTTNHALLGLYLARVEPANRVGYLREIVQHGELELDDSGVVLGLREASKHEPVALEREIGSWFFVRPGADQEKETAIFEGFGSGEKAGGPVLGRLLRKPLPPLTRNAALALHQAGTRFQCPNIGNPSMLVGAPSKGQSEADATRVTKAAESQRAALATAMRACASTLEHMKP